MWLTTCGYFTCTVLFQVTMSNCIQYLWSWDSWISWICSVQSFLLPARNSHQGLGEAACSSSPEIFFFMLVPSHCKQWSVCGHEWECYSGYCVGQKTWSTACQASAVHFLQEINVDIFLGKPCTVYCILCWTMFPLFILQTFIRAGVSFLVAFQ